MALKAVIGIERKEKFTTKMEHPLMKLICLSLQNADLSNICVEYVGWCDKCQFSFSCSFCPVCIIAETGTYGRYEFFGCGLYYTTVSIWEISESNNPNYFTFSCVGEIDEEDRFVFNAFGFGLVESNVGKYGYPKKDLTNFYGKRRVNFLVYVNVLKRVGLTRILFVKVGEVSTNYSVEYW